MASVFSHAVAALGIGACFYLGVAFFSPFNTTRYFLPWRPIRVSPIGVSRFSTDRGLEVVESELFWIWLPAALLVASGWLIRRRSPRRI